MIEQLHENLSNDNFSSFNDFTFMAIEPTLFQTILFIDF